MSIKVKHAAWLSAECRGQEWVRKRKNALFLQTLISNIVNSHLFMYATCNWHHIERTEMWSKFFHLCLACLLSSLMPNWTLFKLFIAVCVPDFMHCTQCREKTRELSPAGKGQQQKAFNQVCVRHSSRIPHIFSLYAP